MSSTIRIKVLSAALMLLMIATPLFGGLTGVLVSHAVSPGTQLVAYPSIVVKGQDLLLTVQQQGGSFTPGATLYIKFSNNNNWGTGDGDAWIGLQPGQTTLPEGAIVYIPHDYSDSAIKGSDSLSAGEAYLLVSDSADGSSGVVGPKLQVEDWGGVYPWIGDTEPSQYVGISYSSSSLPTFRVLSTGALVASPGQTIYLKYFIPGDSVTIYWDYYGGQVLATTSGGKGVVKLTIPDAPEGFHPIVAVSDAGYGAFTWVYVQPILMPDKFSIQGKIGETVTFTGKGFPANAVIATDQPVILTVHDGSATGTMRARIVSGGHVDANGNVVFTIELLDNKPAGISGGIIDVTVRYSSGDVDYVVGGTFTLDQHAPSGDGSDTIQSVMAISTPNAYGDEFMVVFDPHNPQAVLPAGSTIQRYVGQAFKVAVIDFPANTQVTIFVGNKPAGTLTTDDKGAAVGYVKTPALPGYDNNANQIQYTLRAEATDPTTGGTLVGVGVNNNPYKLLINYDVDVEWSPDGYGPDADYLVSGLHTISVYIDGLSPYAKVYVQELMKSLYTINIAGTLHSLYGIETINGSLGPGYFIATSNGVLYIKYNVVYADVLDILGASWNTGDDVKVQIELDTATGNTIAGMTTYNEYYMIQIAAGRIQTVISSPASITPAVETAGPYQVVHPGDFIQVVFTGLVPNEAYTIKLNGMSVQLYDTSNRLRNYLWSDNTGTLVARIQLPNDASVIGLKVLTANYYYGVAQGKVAGVLKFIVSSPRADLYGKARVFVDPNVTIPGATINVIGVNFEAGESLKGGFSTVGVVATGRANNHGAVVFQIRVPYVPAGTYAAYIMRTVTYETFPTTIEVVSAILSPTSPILVKASGDTVTITAIGLEPNTAYMVKWSPTESELGKPLTDTGVPGVGTPLTWFSNGDGLLTITFTVPFGIIGEDYYATIVSVDNPDSPVLSPLEIIIAPGHGFDLEQSPYVIAGQTFTAYADPSLISGLKFPVNLSTATIDEKVAFLATYGKAVAKLTLPDGTEQLLPVTISYDSGYGEIALTFQVPNMNESGVLGVEYRFTLTAPTIIDNSTNPYTVNYTVSDTGWLTLGGIKAVDGGGILLAKVEGQLATIVETVNATVQVLVKKVDDLNMTIMNISDGVATIQTNLGTVQTDVQTLKELLGNVNATLVAKGDEIIAVLNTKAGNITASLSALKQALEQGLGNISLTGITKTLSTVNGKLDQVLSAIAQVQGNTADIKGSIVTVNNNLAAINSAVKDNSKKLDTVDKHVSGLGGKMTLTLLLDVIILILAIIIIAFQLKKAP